MPPRPSRAWSGELAFRIRHLFVLKLAGITAFTWLFFLGYFHLLRFPAYAVVEMPLTVLDRWIPFEPAGLVAYLSLWLYVGIAPGLQRSLRDLLAYGCWAAALCASGLLLFYFWPTRVPPLAPAAASFPGFALMRGIDAAGNACPSMHVAIAVFSARWIDRVCRDAGAPWALRAANAVWLALIVWSTVAVRQHVVLDAVAGAVLGGAFAAASLQWRLGFGASRPADIIRRSETFLRPVSGDGADQGLSGAAAPRGVRPALDGFPPDRT